MIPNENIPQKEVIIAERAPKAIGPYGTAVEIEAIALVTRPVSD